MFAKYHSLRYCDPYQLILHRDKTIDLSDFLNTIRRLIATGIVRISEHGYDELAADELTVKELLNGIDKAQIIEEYLDYPKGKCILLLQEDKHGNPVHVL